MNRADIFVIVGSLLALALLFTPRLKASGVWRATLTPLASIIGSGFLIIGPILVSHFGRMALIPMIILCLTGYAFGSAVRYNIASIAREEGATTSSPQKLEAVASWSLAIAYAISVTYYLNLFGSFAARIVGTDTGQLGRVITSAVFLAILVAGFLRGFSMLERMERVSVSIKLAVIAGLLLGLSAYLAGMWQSGELPEIRAHWSVWQGLPLVLGLLITVQGFETSRYLGDSYPPAIRIRSMLLAQIIAFAIYLIYVSLLSTGFPMASVPISETAIIDLMARVSELLPILLIIAALSSQFSAALAVTGSSGGLVEELTHGRVVPRNGYVLIVFAGLLLTWLSDVFSIISFASRAFALYYALQSAIAAKRAWNGERLALPRFLRAAFFSALCLSGLLILALGVPVDA